MDMDLEEFRAQRGLSYRQLAAFLKETVHAKVRDWAIGRCWPHADSLEVIFAATEGRVTLVGMHRRRLRWLKEHRAESVQDQTVTHVTELAS